MTGPFYTGTRAVQRRRVVALAALGSAVAVTAAVALLAVAGSGSAAEAALERFVTAFEQGDYAAAAAETDGDPDRVAAALEANVEGLDGAELAAEIVAFEEEDDRASATVSYTWQVPVIGELSYDNRELRLRARDGQWRVRWSERTIHPELGDGERLGTVKRAAERAPILDRDGKQLVRLRPAVEIGVIPSELEDRSAAIDAIAAATDADPKALRRSIRAAQPTNFVPAITVRASELEPIEAQLGEIEGIEFGDRELPLAPSREFARALLGSVGPITAEQLEELDDSYAAGDLVGQGGLQEAHEDRLAGSPTYRVVVRDAADVPVETLLEREGEPGKPLRTTLDAGVQAAAERALGELDENAALVAVEPSSGDLLAVANRPTDDAFNRALEGQYPPGSTFKVIATAALLEAGLDPDETVECPATIDVGGRSFRNFEGGASGTVPFRTDFAESCNTAFVSLADRLEPRALTQTARRFGLGAEYELGVPAFAGSVPPGRDAVEEAAAMIGQARILASPLAMAGVAATVAEGRWRAPRVLGSDPREQGPRLDEGELDTLRELMRLVIMQGTGTALASLPGEPLGKSGTAEYGSGDPPPTHAWFVAARDDLAVAVLVEDRPSGGEHAAPIVADFLAELGV